MTITCALIVKFGYLVTVNCLFLVGQGADLFHPSKVNNWIIHHALIFNSILFWLFILFFESWRWSEKHYRDVDPHFPWSQTEDSSDGSQEKMVLISYLGQLLRKVEQNHGDYILKVHLILPGYLVLFLGKLMGQKHWNWKAVVILAALAWIQLWSLQQITSSW